MIEAVRKQRTVTTEMQNFRTGWKTSPFLPKCHNRHCQPMQGDRLTRQLRDGRQPIPARLIEELHPSHVGARDVNLAVPLTLVD